MNELASVATAPLVKRNRVIIQRGLIDIKPASVGSQYGDELRREVQDLPKLCFALPDLRFRLLFGGHIHHRPNKLDAARFMAQGVSHHLETFDGTIRHQQSM